ncbi:SDR family oxidoreductase [Planococcus sp. CP5-4]|uniref:NAD(P)-dependent oxidoreductase n=1 Tax=unclassified Planococcus (in: firmicutes) TaxID=2662419 RepID=UPI001C243C4D|nr:MULTISPECIES: NAD(P)-binding oxidoreductase [unclassified Planococcus (in: firmicutes)]MBU9674221.1 SDR family oxidoreductase [Planococcus sp. CP5-4_YE]MBV0909307.1 SDR family oxidoreductase [Planococcus sp. CP5-4_UN]MBW6063799.1 SDR family oxidoreductase [Planococcus sp. CP5-4]
MKIIVFGATGGVGRSVVKQALEQGYEVTAFVRTPDKLKVTGDKLTVVQGDAFHVEQVAAAIAGHDAVVSCLGSNQGMKKSKDLRTMAKNIVAGMQQHGVKRIVYTASAGINDELPGIGGKVMMGVLKQVLIDHRAAVDAIQEAGLTYTIVRPMGLTNDSLSGQYRESEQGVPGKSKTIPRADVAHFILKALGDAAYENKSIGIAT